MSDADHLLAEAAQIYDRIVQQKMQYKRKRKGNLIGSHTAKNKGQGNAFWQFRTFLFGDSRRHIDWKQSAKSDDLIIREREKENAPGYMLWVDPSQRLRFGSDKAVNIKKDYALILACICAKKIKKEQGRLSFATLEDRAQQNLNFFLEEAVNDESPCFEKVKKIQPKNKSVIPLLFSDFWGDDHHFLKDIEVYIQSRNHGILVAVVDPAETSFPFSGRMLFENMNAASNTMIGKAEMIRPEYLKRVSEHQKKISDLCAQNNWSYIFLQTDMPLVEAGLKVMELV